MEELTATRKPGNTQMVFRFLGRTPYRLERYCIEDNCKITVRSLHSRLEIEMTEPVMEDTVIDFIVVLLADQKIISLHKDYLNLAKFKISGLPTVESPLAAFTNSYVYWSLKFARPPYTRLYLEKVVIPGVRAVEKGYELLANAGYSEILESTGVLPRLPLANKNSFILLLAGKRIITPDLARTLMGEWSPSPSLVARALPTSVYVEHLKEESPFFRRAVEYGLSRARLGPNGKILLAYEFMFRAFDRPEKFSAILSRTLGVPVRITREDDKYRFVIGKNGREIEVRAGFEDIITAMSETFDFDQLNKELGILDVLRPNWLITTVSYRILWNLMEQARDILPPTYKTCPSRDTCNYIRPAPGSLTIYSFMRNRFSVQTYTSASELAHSIEWPLYPGPDPEETFRALGEDFYGGERNARLARETGTISLADVELLYGDEKRKLYVGRVVKDEWVLIEETPDRVRTIKSSISRHELVRLAQNIWESRVDEWAPEIEEYIRESGKRIIRKDLSYCEDNGVIRYAKAIIYPVGEEDGTVSARVIIYESDDEPPELLPEMYGSGNDEYILKFKELMERDGWKTKVKDGVLLAWKGRRRVFVV